ncbi:cell division protein FtsQ/DivIB [Borrelia sp. CA_690]|uniref:FtsQ-type POTRA domain-containing protein n=1 Tax=Borrelia maritima TaxID=2761123 RepID=A0A5J6WB28_9SPIR|nr:MULTISPECIES: FtsQ-type POTRA domain-containing protein [Borrelia]QFI14436.1 FtsQ-type POTRA domain-containing protein [Borrelia maritima]WKC84291.1 FtsQ-type POTRA domain-containing protein [Borrelia sp. CA_690]
MIFERKFLVKYIYFSISLIFFEIIIIIFVSPYFLIRYISINNDISLSKEDIIKISGIKPNTYYHNTNVKMYEENLRRDLRIKNAKVDLKFPNKINIKVEKRIPVAVALENANGNITYYYIASDGVILEKSKYLIYDLPIISGLVLNYNNVGDFLEDRMLNIVRGLDYLKINQKYLYNLVSEVNFLKLNFYDYNVILYIKSIYNKILVTVDMDLIDAMHKAFLAVDLLKGKPGIIDLRSGDIILLGEG